MVAAQFAQRGLDNGGQRGLALVVDGGTAEVAILATSAGAASICMQPPTGRAYLCQIKIVQVILAGANQETFSRVSSSPVGTRVARHAPAGRFQTG